MNDRLRESTVQRDATIRDGMRSLDRSETQIVLVVDGLRLLGTATDGDIRRGLLAGATLDSPLAAHMNRRFFSVGPGAGRAEVLELMQARQIVQVPVVDDDMNVVGLHLLHEMLGVAERDNHAVIMAGGRGTRLAPLTESVPKPMLPVAGRPILERILLHLVGCGIRHVYLAVNYRAEMIEDYFGTGHAIGCRIEYLREDEPLGTGGALALLPRPPSHPLLVMNGDLITQVNVGGLFEFHERGDQTVTMAVRKYYHTIPYGCVDTRGSELVGFDEKPTISRLVNAGMYVLDPDVVGLVQAGESLSMPDIIQRALDRGDTVRVREIDEDWIDVGRHEELDRARGR